MSIDADLRRELKKNDYTLDIIEADELIAVWRYKRSNRFTRSVDFSRVPQQWRYSAPPSDSDDLMPCHVSLELTSARDYSRIVPAYELADRLGSCHHSGRRWSDRQVPSLTELDAVEFAKRNVTPYISPILDARTLALVCNELGLKGKAVPKVIKGRQYIILSGYPGLRNRLPGTIYSASNRKIVQMAIGALGIKGMVKSGARLTIGLTVPLTILECFLKDQATMASLIGDVASDLAKIGIGAIMSAIAGIAVGTVVSYAVVPIFVTIAVSVLGGIAMEQIDKHFGLTDKLIEKIEKYIQGIRKKREEMENKLGRVLHEADREFVWRAYDFDIDNPDSSF